MTMSFQIKNGDLVLSGTGRPRLVADTDKLSQDIAQFLGQAADIDGFGASLDQLIGVDDDPYALRAEIVDRIFNAVVAYQRLQERYQPTARTSKERLAQIARLSVVLNERVKTTFDFRFDAISAEGVKPLVISGTLVV